MQLFIYLFIYLFIALLYSEFAITKVCNYKQVNNTEILIQTLCHSNLIISLGRMYF